MSKERGSFAGASGGARSAGGGPKGGVGLASRSMEAPRSFGAESGFSSRGLASFGKSADRPTLSFGNAAKPSLNIGNTERPSLSMQGTKFESSKSTPIKTPGVRYSPDFRGTPLSAIRHNEVSAKLQGNMRPEVSPVLTGPVSQVREISKPVVSLSRTRLQPTTQESRAQKPTGLVTREALRNAVPFGLPGQEQRATQAPRLIQRPLGEARIQNAPTVDRKVVTPLQDTFKKAEIKPAELYVKNTLIQPKAKDALTVRRDFISKPDVQVRPGYRTTIDISSKIDSALRLASAVASAKESQNDVVTGPVIDTKVIQKEALNLQTRGLSRLAYLPFDSEILDEDVKKDKQKFEAEQIDRVAMAYLRAGLVANKGEAMRRVDRVLGIDPAVLATNPRIDENITVSPIPERIGITAPVEVPAINKMPRTEILPKIKSDVQVTAETKTQLLAKAKGITVAETTRVDQADPSTQPDAKMNVQSNQKKGVQRLVKSTKDKIEKMKVWTTKLQTPTLDKSDENIFKIDKPKQKNRLKLWSEAVRSVFPYFKPEYRVKLNEIARGLKNPDSSTESTLVEQLNLDSDGSEYEWRNPLLHSDTEVTQGEAKFAGEYLIYTKPPVIMNEAGLDAKEEDVQRVMRGKPREEVFESSD